jgi:hypothetical protein
MKKLLILILMGVALISPAQQHKYVYLNPEDSTFKSYLIILPQDQEIKGLVVRDFSKLPDISKPSPYKWSTLALKNGLAIAFTVSSNYFPELYYDDSGPAILDNLIHHIYSNYSIPKDNLFIGGISASGTRALRFVQYCVQGKSKYNTKVKGVFSVDPPLDLERFYNSAHQHKENFKDGMLWEAELMEKVFPEKMGGSPQAYPNAYLSYSVFSHSKPKKSKAIDLLRTSLLFIHEPDIDWWITERGASYYDINSYDIAAITNFLRLAGHKDLEHITTTGKGFNRKGERKCHSWTIVDEAYLIKWMLDRLD